jgi:WD40 repeat protein
VTAVAALVLPDGTPVAVTGSDDATVRVWNLATGQPLGEPVTGHTYTVTAVAALVLPDGTPVAVTGSLDAKVRVWNLATGQPLGPPLTGHTRTVRAVAALVLPDGTPVAVTGSDDATVRVWSLTTGQAYAAQLPLPSFVSALAVGHLSTAGEVPVVIGMGRRVTVVALRIHRLCVSGSGR